jgi:hypothetical protein
MSIRLAAFEGVFINFTLGTTFLKPSSLMFSTVADRLPMLILLQKNYFLCDFIVNLEIYMLQVVLILWIRRSFSEG